MAEGQHMIQNRMKMQKTLLMNNNKNNKKQVQLETNQN